jgi:hypothetical protein
MKKLILSLLFCVICLSCSTWEPQFRKGEMVKSNLTNEVVCILEEREHVIWVRNKDYKEIAMYKYEVSKIDSFNIM